MNESSHMNESNMNESSHMDESSRMNESSHMNESCHMFEYIMLHAPSTTLLRKYSRNHNSTAKIYREYTALLRGKWLFC